jgi:two-component system OmpR family sensor kinase
MRWRWLLILIPLLLGVLLATLLNNSEIQNPLFRILISLSSLLLIAAVLTTLVLFAFVAFWRYLEVRHKAQIAALESRAAEDRRRFLRRLDHELKNPLMAIRAGLANFANAPTAASRKSALATVEAQTVRLSRLTTDLRKIAELENRPLELSRIDLEQLLQEVIDLAREQPQAFEREIRLTLSQVPWPLPAISGDWDLIFLATYNLLDNALKFSQPGDTIEVRGREDNRYVYLEVADTGPGIREEELPHVWEELYRGDSGRSVPGSGLGLALVRAIAERHGGEAAIASRAGRGTMTTIQLPIEAPSS